ncbi:helix-turn-helix domain-containing protein [Actinomycetospora endophytica]|uniref:Helix-turn-helix domain-containing protein n=1 Tax=Actinomycetospora endophytica TaxID=2291215 RepID=A0ABS8P5T6_9PSEU|nr:helix-turn-helix transcriptional regulator [Actinomycetospora endophytica]MCD2192761.1 helix-turn-helix domain-containing protein [Actinomycetospora endophytica]
MSGPVVVRRRLGVTLRRLREAAGLRLEQVAAELEVSPAKISRIETGHSAAKTWDVRNLLTVYGVEDPDRREQILGWVEESKAFGWWHPHSDVLPMNLDYYISLEAEAASVSLYAPLVPALLQTRSYARALLADLFVDVDHIGEGDLDRLVDIRMGRQAALRRAENPLGVSVVLDEVALLRMVGGPEVMREQLIALQDVMGSVEVRVRPLTAPVRRFALSSFAIFHPRLTTVDHAVVNIEAAGRDYYLEEAADVLEYQGAFRALWTESLGADESLAAVRSLIG